MDSILTSIKKLLGLTKEDKSFDPDIIMHINTAFMNLTQLGVGPEEGFSISDSEAIWDDFISSSNKQFESVRTYVYLKVRLVFDPPTGSAVLDSMNRTISELEWRLNIAAESTKS